MLSNKELVEALTKYLKMYGFSHLLIDRDENYLSSVGNAPSYLVDPVAAANYRAANRRVKETESLADQDLASLEEIGIFTIPATGVICASFDLRSRKENLEDLQQFIRNYFNYQDLEIKFSIVRHESNRNAMYRRFPFALGGNAVELNVVCSIPNSQGNEPDDIAVASVKCNLTNHYVIGPKYTTISDIEVGSPEEGRNILSHEGTSAHTTHTKLPFTLLYKVGPKLNDKEGIALTDGSANMLLSVNSETRVLASELLCSLFQDGKLHDQGVTQKHTMKSVACLLSDGKLFYGGIQVVAANTQLSTDPENNTTNISHTCSTLISCGPDFTNVELHVLFSATLEKRIGTEGNTYYCAPSYEFSLFTDNEHFLQSIKDSDNPIFKITHSSSSERGISCSLLGQNFAKNFSQYMEARAIEEAVQETHMQDSNPVESQAHVTASIEAVQKTHMRDSGPVESQAHATPEPSATNVQTPAYELPRVASFQKPSLLERILEIPTNICKRIYRVLSQIVDKIVSCASKTFDSIFGTRASENLENEKPISVTLQGNVCNTKSSAITQDSVALQTRKDSSQTKNPSTPSSSATGVKITMVAEEGAITASSSHTRRQ